MQLDDEALNVWGALDVPPVFWESLIDPKDRLGGPSPWGNSKYQAFKQCPYLFELLYVRGYSHKTPDPNLEIGGLFHEALARYFKAALDGADDIGCFAAMWGVVDLVSPKCPVIAAEVRRLLTGWIGLYGPNTPDDYRPRVLHVEPVLQVEKPFRYSAALDLVLRAPHGAVDIVEHKTSARYDATLLSSYRMEPQFIGHLWLAQQYGWEVRRYYVDLIVKTASPRYEHLQMSFAPVLFKNWESEMRQVAEEVARYRRSVTRWPRRTTYRCRFCVAFDHCASGGTSLDGFARAPGFRTYF